MPTCTRETELLQPTSDVLPDLDQAYQATSRPARILLAEDDPEMRNLLGWGLTEDGYRVVEASNGLELLRSFELSLLDRRHRDGDNEFDLIISDIRMPVLTGLEVLEYIRKLDRTTPVILITAFGDPSTHAEARRQGAAAVIDKPFELDDLRSLLRLILPPRLHGLGSPVAEDDPENDHA